MISVCEVSKQYGDHVVVDTVSLDINPGEIVGILGPNGAGKTTTFHMIIGLIKPDKGKVFLNGKDITGMPIHKRARMGLGYLPQDSSIFKKLTVEENVFILWELLKNVPRRDFDKRLDALLDEMGILHLRKSKGIQLSGGEKRRVEIVRALAMEPHFILLDEPFAGVDPIATFEIQSIMLTLKNKGLGVLITDHNVRETLSITDRAYLLYDGKVLFSGSSHDISTNEVAKKFYLGQNFSL